VTGRLFGDSPEPAEDEPPRAGAGGAFCQCERNRPYTSPDLDIWVSDRERAFCRACGRDLHPAKAAAWYGRAQAELERFGRRFPGFDQQVPPPR
jgi:hypothetical protein